MARLQLLVPLLFLVSLPARAQGPAASEPRSSAATSAQTSAAPAPAPPPGPLATQAAGFLMRWLEAQNRGDFAAYQALYADGFIGVRRSGAQVRQLDRPGWFKDRARMFQRPMVVQAADATLTHRQGHLVLQFRQSFSSGTYHDRGPKVLHLGPSPGGLLILREELLSSEKLAEAEPKAAAPPSVRYVCVGSISGDDPAVQDAVIAECEPQCERDPVICAFVGHMVKGARGSRRPPDLPRALRLYEQGCKRGDMPHICEAAASILLQGGGPDDAERGLALLDCAKRRCEGEPYRSLLVATGKPENIRRALTLYEERCDAGNSDPTLLDGTEACEAAADIYEEGSLGKPQRGKAERLRRRAKHLRRQNEKVWEACPEC